MAINLPNSPTNGQTVTVGNKTLVYSTSLSVWQIQSSPAGATVTTSDTAPASPSDGDMWFDSATLNTFIYYADGSSNQWVKANPSGSTGPQGIQGVAGAAGASGGNGVATIVADMAGLIALSGMSAGAQAYITSNNKLYFYNGSGWYLIATVQNDAPSAITGVDGTYALDATGTATTITAVSTDPEGFALTWSYATSGLGSIATVSQTDNVFTITPSTVDANAGTFTLTISATDGVNGAVNAVTSMSLSFIVTNSRHTSLLVSVNEPAAPSALAIAVGNSGASAYTLSGGATGNNAAVNLTVGQTVNFTVNASGHPFYLRDSNGGSNVSSPAATNQGTTSGVVSWTPNTAGTYYYQCGYHSGMIGTITVSPISIVNNTFTDSSSSTHTITPSGDPIQGSFNPYRKGGYSLSSEKGSAGVIGTAANDYAIKIADSADLDVASGEDFTYEFWFKADPQPAGDVWPATSIILTSLRNVFYGGNGWYPQVRLYRYTSGAYAGKDTMSVYINSGFKDLYTEIDRSVWNHICIIRTSNVWKFYINGTEDTYQPGWVSNLHFPFTESAPVIAQGAWAGNDGVDIKDFRYVVGTAIVPPAGGPSEPLSVVSGTKFLLCSLPYLADANNTADGGLAPKTVIQGDYINKIIPSSPYDYGTVNTTDGGSIEFDGSNDYIYTQSNLTDFDFGTGQFTISFWYYATQQTNNQGAGIISGQNHGGFNIQYDNEYGGTSNGIYMYLAGLSEPAIQTGSIGVNQWHYISVQRESTTSLKIYVDGIQSATLTLSASYEMKLSGTDVRIGRGFDINGSGAYFKGKVSDLRIVKGTNSGFAVPVEPLTAVTNTKLLMSGQGANIFDKAQVSNFSLLNNTTGSATIPSGAAFSGTHSVSFNGSSDHIIVSGDISNFDYNSDFTIEAFVQQATSTNAYVIFSKFNTAGNQRGFLFGTGWDGSKRVVNVRYSTDGANSSHTQLNGTATVATNTFVHLALVKSGSNLIVYIDGTGETLTSSMPTLHVSTAPFLIGANYQNSNVAGTVWNGQMHSLRIKQKVEYSSNFTAPTAPLKG